MGLTSKNYYSAKANSEYFSVSQYKDFLNCPAMALAKIRGEYEPEKGRALLLGSYVDEMLTGTKKSKAKFIEENQVELFKKNGDPYADVLQASETVARIMMQPLMISDFDFCIHRFPSLKFRHGFLSLVHNRSNHPLCLVR